MLRRMRIEVETFAKDSDAPAQISPELVLVSPPEEARAAREALPERPSPPTVRAFRPPPRAEPGGQVAPEAEPPAAPSPRRRSRWLLIVPALVLAACGFVVGRQLGERRGSNSAAAEPATAQPVPRQTTTTAAAPRSGTSTGRTSSNAPSRRPQAKPAPIVSWKARPGIRSYRLDLLRGGVVILTILTDQPSTKIPLTWPNAGRRRRLTPGTYTWTVRAATARASRPLAHGTIRVR
jgi:hypothetical protein